MVRRRARRPHHSWNTASNRAPPRRLGVSCSPRTAIDWLHQQKVRTKGIRPSDRTCKNRGLLLIMERQSRRPGRVIFIWYPAYFVSHRGTANLYGTCCIGTSINLLRLALDLQIILVALISSCGRFVLGCIAPGSLASCGPDSAMGSLFSAASAQQQRATNNRHPFHPFPPGASLQQDIQ